MEERGRANAETVATEDTVRCGYGKMIAAAEKARSTLGTRRADNRVVYVGERRGHGTVPISFRAGGRGVDSQHVRILKNEGRRLE